MINDIIYNKNSLYIILSGKVQKKIIDKLKKQLYFILNEYDIREITINVDNVSIIDKDYFYTFLDDYDLLYGGKLIVKKETKI